MFTDLYRLLPPEGVKILLVLFLAFLTGLEREERRDGTGQFSFGGVRTYPLIGLIAYGISFLAGGEILPVTLGFAVVAGFLMLSYRNKLQSAGTAGVTSEMSALTTYVAAALVYREQFWIATTLTVASMLLLELKGVLEGLTQRIAPEEILTFTKFLLLTAVILPVLPNREFGPFAINPAKAWLVVVAVSTVSYGSYVIQKVTKGQGGVMLSALLGGAYSSTVTTVVLAKRAKSERPAAPVFRSHPGCLRHDVFAAGRPGDHLQPKPDYDSGSAVSGPRRSRHRRWLVVEPDSRCQGGRRRARVRAKEPSGTARRPGLRGAFRRHAGGHAPGGDLPGQGGRILAGGSDGRDGRGPVHHGNDAGRGSNTSLGVAAAAILIAASSNNLVKGIYSFSLSDRKTGVLSLSLLAALAAAGLTPLLWLAR